MFASAEFLEQSSDKYLTSTCAALLYSLSLLISLSCTLLLHLLLVLLSYLFPPLPLCSRSTDIYNEWCSLCGASMCVVEPREHHLSDDSVCPSLSYSRSHTHAWLAGNTGSCCIRPLWQRQLEKSRQHKLSSHTVPIREGGTSSEER